MIERVVEQFPNIKMVATTLREVHSTNRHDWAAVLWLDGKRYVSPTCQLDVLDRIGGGDGFAAGPDLRPARRPRARRGPAPRLGPRRPADHLPRRRHHGPARRGRGLRQGRLGPRAAVVAHRLCCEGSLFWRCFRGFCFGALGVLVFLPRYAGAVGMVVGRSAVDGRAANAVDVFQCPHLCRAVRRFRPSKINGVRIRGCASRRSRGGRNFHRFTSLNPTSAAASRHQASVSATVRSKGISGRQPVAAQSFRVSATGSCFAPV